MNDLFCWESKYESCAYSESLLNKIDLQNEKSNHQVDILEIKKAIYYAKKYYGSQKRLPGEPSLLSQGIEKLTLFIAKILIFKI